MQNPVQNLNAVDSIQFLCSVAMSLLEGKSEQEKHELIECARTIEKAMHEGANKALDKNPAPIGAIVLAVLVLVRGVSLSVMETALNHNFPVDK